MSSMEGMFGFFSDPVFLAWLALGILLICIELFVPGGVVGSIGFCIVLATILFGTHTVADFFLVSALVTVTTVIVLFLVVKLIPEEAKKNGLFLNMRLTKQQGFSSGEDLSFYLDKEGVTKSILRPSGKICVEQTLLDARSENTFIESDKKVRVIGVEGNKLIVREME